MEPELEIYTKCGYRPDWNITWKDYAFSALTAGTWALYKQDEYIRAQHEFNLCVSEITRKKLEWIRKFT